MAAEPTWTVIESSDSHSESSIELVLHCGEESWEWLKQVILGEFDEDRELSAILADMTISLVPGVIIITSARDMIAIIARLSLHPERRNDVMEWVLLFGTVVPIAYPLIAAGVGAVADGVGAIVTGGAALETDGILGGIVRSICLLLLRGAREGEKLLAEIIKLLQAHVAGNIYEFLKTVRFSDYIKPICDVIGQVIEQLLALGRKASDSLWRYHPTYRILDYFADITTKLKTFERKYYELQTQLPTKLSEAATWLQQKLDEILRIDPPASGPMLATAGGDIGELGALAAAEERLLPAWPTNPLGVPPEVAMANKSEEGAAHIAGSTAHDGNVHAVSGGSEELPLGISSREFDSKWRPKDVERRRVYQRNDLFDPHQLDSRKRSNIDRMKRGLAPIGKDGRPLNLHHLTQDEPGAMAEIATTMHSENHRTLHIYSNGYDKTWIGEDGVRRTYNSAPPSMNRGPFELWKRQYWKARAQDFERTL